MHEYSKRIGEHIKSCYSDFNKMTREELDELKDWACVMKDLTEYDINKRGIEAMDEAEQEEKFYGRMGYRGRAANGRFVHRSGRGRSAGYTPYMHMMDDGMDEYDMYDEMPYPMTGYRMGYTGGRGGNSGNSGGRGNSGSRGGNSNSGNSGSYGYGDGDGRMGYGNVMKNYSRYGQAYDRYDQNRRHYTETKDPEDKKAMKESMNEIFSDMESMVENIMEYADASEKPELKQKIVQMAQKVQQMK